MPDTKRSPAQREPRVYLCCWKGCTEPRPAPRVNAAGRRIKTAYCREHATEYRREYRRARRGAGKCACGAEPVAGTGQCEPCARVKQAHRARVAPSPEERAARAEAAERKRAEASRERRALAERLGPVLLETRLARDLDQEAVAKAARVTQQTIARYEAGQSAPRGPVLARMARVFGTTPEALLIARASRTREELEAEARTRAARLARAGRSSGRRRASEIQEGRAVLPDLRAARLAAGRTQAQVAEAAGITQSLYSRYESGALVPRAEDLETIERVLGIGKKRRKRA